MKKIRVCLVLAVILAVILSVSGVHAAAVTVTQDDLEITLTANKEEFTGDEQIKTTLTVKNFNAAAVTNVDLETSVPEGYQLAQNAQNKLSFASVASGEAVISEVVLTKTPVKTEESAGEENSAAKTVRLVLIIAAAVLAAVIIAVAAVLIVKKKKAGKQMLSILLCLCLLGAAAVSGGVSVKAADAGDTDAVISASAAAQRKSADVVLSVKADEKTLAIKGTVAYDEPILPVSSVITGLTADQSYFVCGEDASITFTVRADSTKQNISLLKNDNDYVGVMRDDGADGDETPGDGIYTYVLNTRVDSAVSVTETYHAKWEDEVSNETSIYYFAQLNAEQAKAAQEKYVAVTTALQNTEKKYADEMGYVPDYKRDSLIAELKTTLDAYVSDGSVLQYKEENGSFDVKLASGLGLSYSPKFESNKYTDTLGENETATVVTLQPCFTDMGGRTFSSSAYELPQGVNYILEMLDDVAGDVDTAFTNYSFPSSLNFDDNRVSLNIIKTLHENQVVLWHGHGYYGPMVKSCLVTGEDFDWNRWWFDFDYFGDCVANRIINSVLTGYDKVIISSGYIDRYCGNMNNSFVYLAACLSGKTSELANAFLNKGCAAVVANSETIMRSYNVAMLYETVRLMTTVNTATNNYYSLEEAQAAAKAVYDANDGTARYGGIGATPIIFGGTNARNYRFEDSMGTLSGRICKASDRTTAIPNATINIYQNGTVLRTEQSDVNGNYSVSLGAGEYYFEIKAAGYIDFHSYATVAKSETTYVETFLLIDGSAGQKGVARGNIVNSLTNVAVEGVRLTVRNDWNNAYSDAQTVATAVTDSRGDYQLELPLGNYTVVLTKDGYLPSSFNIIVQSGTTENQNATITPVVSGDEYLITLTWDENPRDLDAHVQGTLSTGGSFHTYYDHMNDRDGDVTVCSLDYDDRYSYGPEHITPKTTSEKPYYFYVYRYAGSGSVASSGAQVTVHKGNQLIRTFNVPTNLGSEDYWNVFAVVGGEIVTRNTITSSAELDYAG